MSQEPKPSDVFMNRPHVVLLGAGASRAAFPNGDRCGHTLPLMRDIIKTVELGTLLDKFDVRADRDDFERLYSDLVAEGNNSELIGEIEHRLFVYFAKLELPDEPTLYDHLVLSLRDKDVIATFNWDPFLWQAINRCNERLEGFVDMPRVLFLHGNTAIGYTMNNEQVLFGTLDTMSRANGNRFEQGPLLFPVAQKNYQQEECIRRVWDLLKTALGHAYLFTVFGYGAPATDVEAVDLLKQGWGDRHNRNLEEVEIINDHSEKELRQIWRPFIHSHHYRTTDSFYESIIAKSPRRSCDTMWGELMDRNPIYASPLPWAAGWDELIAAVRKLASAELPKEGRA